MHCGEGDTERAMDAVLGQFRKFDKNGDGVITKAELRRVLQALNPKVWTDKNVTQLLCHIDRDGDGLIQFEEFVSWLHDDTQDKAQEKEVFPEEARKAAADVMQSKSRAANSAAKAGEFINVLRLVKEQPEVVNMQHKSSGETLLHQAVLHGNAFAVQQLLELKGDPALPNKAGLTVVQLAVRLKDEEVLEVLEAAGCCIPRQLKQAAEVRTAHRSVSTASSLSPTSTQSPTSPERSTRAERSGRPESRECLSRGGSRRSGRWAKDDDSRDITKDDDPRDDRRGGSKGGLGGTLRLDMLAATT